MTAGSIARELWTNQFFPLDIIPPWLYISWGWWPQFRDIASDHQNDDDHHHHQQQNGDYGIT
jgi:hypothetical protein